MAIYDFNGWGKTMNILNMAGAAIALALLGSASHAATIANFQALADGSYGESAYNDANPLLVSGLSITADRSVNDGTATEAFAYLDANVAGLGVCGALKSGATTGKRDGLGSNICNPSSDDSLQLEESDGNGGTNTLSEILEFEAVGGDALIGRVFVNFNHDKKSGLKDDWEWKFGGSTYKVSDGSLVTTGATTGYFDANLLITAGSSITAELIGGPNSYIEAFGEVPLPAAGFLLLGGLGGLAALKRRKKAA